jgi:hypothetical protein
MVLLFIVYGDRLIVTMLLFAKELKQKIDHNTLYERNNEKKNKYEEKDSFTVINKLIFPLSSAQMTITTDAKIVGHVIDAATKKTYAICYRCNKGNHHRNHERCLRT